MIYVWRELRMKQNLRTDTARKTRKQLEQENTKLQSLSELDGLTGLYNRVTIERRINEHLRRNLPGTMLVLDLDHFKQVNDRYGHIAGDMLLCIIANVLKKMYGGKNLVGRVGGDEFVIFMVSLLDEDSQMRECRRVQERFREVTLNHTTLIKLSITIESSDSRFARHYREMFDCADQKIVAKKRLRNLSNGMSARSQEPAGILPDMSLIAQEMEEHETRPGAYCQDYETFKRIYQLEERRLRRDRKKAFIILFTLTDSHNGFLPLEERDTEMAILGREIQNSLRMGDVFTQYSSCQYLVMTLDVSLEHVDVIAHRICSTYYGKHDGITDNLILHHSYPLKPVKEPRSYKSSCT